MQNKTDNFTKDTFSGFIRKHENHPSIMKIKENINRNFLSLLSSVTSGEGEKEINVLDILKFQPQQHSHKNH